jgi:hypothetical protein
VASYLGGETRHTPPNHYSQLGESNGNSKLKERQVKDIKQRLKRRESQYAIAGDYGVSQGIISRIKLGKVWEHVA